jgi:hypothetical protein
MWRHVRSFHLHAKLSLNLVLGVNASFIGEHVGVGLSISTTSDVNQTS